jgi:hypothetical protein
VAEKKKRRYSSASAKYLTWKQKSKTNQKKKKEIVEFDIFIFRGRALFSPIASAEVAPVISRGPVKSADLQFALCHQSVCSQPMRVIDIRTAGIG